MLLVGFGALAPATARWLWPVVLSLATGWAAGYFTTRSATPSPTGERPRPLTDGSPATIPPHFGHRWPHGVSVLVGTGCSAPVSAPIGAGATPLALPWMVDEHGELRPEHADDYVLVGSVTADERPLPSTGPRFASLAPAD